MAPRGVQFVNQPVITQAVSTFSTFFANFPPPKYLGMHTTCRPLNMAVHKMFLLCSYTYVSQFMYCGIFYSAAPIVCPVISPAVNMFMIGGRLYHQSVNELEWQDAKRYCNNLNLELASIRTPEEFDNVKNHLGENVW